MNKSSDMAVSGEQPEKSDKNRAIHLNEIIQYPAERHLSSNEAVLQIILFSIH